MVLVKDRQEVISEAAAKAKLELDDAMNKLITARRAMRRKAIEEKAMQKQEEKTTREHFEATR